ncbi:MAG TPA: 4a-hydroxytetrahydrobiopterin dehydratase [Candidatus Polarisedimenticolaceae bacterium]|nr:4a-hydroxytetrahydrobiopterin dehydratase [Candidatus Polarisedimenticolaceae bacterium]
MTDLASRSCSPQQGPALTADRAKKLLEQLSGWTMSPDAKEIRRTFKFQSYYATIAFVNAVAWIAHREDHHPDMTVGYNTATVAFSTHSVGGLSENDFISAAKIDALGTL